MSTSKTALSKIKRSPILGLLIMLCFILASKVGASTLHKPEAYRIVSHEAQPRAISATFPKPLCSNCEVTFTGIEIIQ